MKPRLILLLVATIGFLPGLAIIIISLLSCLSKQPDDVIGGSRLPSSIGIAGLDISMRPTLFPMIVMLAGITLYIGAFIWMTRPLR